MTFMLIYKNENKIVTLTNQKLPRLVRDFVLKGNKRRKG